MDKWFQTTDSIQSASVYIGLIGGVIGIIGGVIGIISGIYALKKVKMDLKEGKRLELERLKADIIVEKIHGNTYPKIIIRNIGEATAKNVTMKVFRKSNQEAIENHFSSPFSSTLNASQEEASYWTYLEGTEPRGTYAQLKVTWDDDYTSNRVLVQDMVLEH